MPLPVCVATDELLTLTVTEHAASAVVTAAGEVDSCSAPWLAAALEDAFADGVLELTVDMTAVSFLDSAGVHTLAAAYRRAATAGIHLRVLATRRAVLRPLQLTGLWPLLGADSTSCGPRATA